MACSQTVDQIRLAPELPVQDSCQRADSDFDYISYLLSNPKQAI